MAIVDDLRAVAERIEQIRQTRPIMYYVSTDRVARGRALQIAAPGWPEVFMIHPDDMPTLRAQLGDLCDLVDFHTWQPGAEELRRMTDWILADYTPIGEPRSYWRRP